MENTIIGSGLKKFTFTQFSRNNVFITYCVLSEDVRFVLDDIATMEFGNRQMETDEISSNGSGGGGDIVALQGDRGPSGAKGLKGDSGDRGPAGSRGPT